MMLADMLSAFGHKVDGPYNRFSDAILAAKTGNLQAGILDVNLGGEKTYAVADILSPTERCIRLRNRLRARQHCICVFPCTRAAEADRGRK